MWLANTTCKPPAQKGVRLSWPKANDKRRAKVALTASPLQRDATTDGSPGAGNMHIVHVSQENLQMHYDFDVKYVSRSARPSLQMPLSWNPFQLDVEDEELFRYFLHTASQSLAIHGYSPMDLGQVLVRMALMGSVDSSRAVRLSLLAFSSTHRHHVCTQAVELKISALEALAASSGDQITTEEAIQHVAAGMLLCSVEIHHTSCTSGQWIHYIDGVKNVIKVAGLADKAHQYPDLAILLDWVYYHDVLLHFTRRYWPAIGESKENAYTATAIVEAYHTRPAALATMDLLADVFNAVITQPSATASAETVEEYKCFVRILDWKIRNIPVTNPTENGGDDTTMTAEVYKLAMLVYLHQASDDVLGHALRTQRYIDEGFARFAKMSSCSRQFPLFILGCEARSDAQRSTILDLISRTEATVYARSLEQIRILMQAVWAQEELANEHINYTAKLSYIFSCCRNVPSFV
ncbi:fungal-specific transcription factor domain-containing protein [Poronia punctata]|nr:fungal-specific transcription factor domain-containing protein [Poronia punctata]